MLLLLLAFASPLYGGEDFPRFRVDLTALQHHRYESADAIQKASAIFRRLDAGVGQCPAQGVGAEFTMDTQIGLRAAEVVTCGQGAG